MPFIQQFDDTMQLLQKVLDLRSRNQQIISSNIANSDTPGYSPASFQFEDQLREALDGGELRPVASRPGHISITPATVTDVQGELHRTRDQTGIGDENGVQVEQEMIKLSENQILYEAAISMLNKKLAILKYTANDGR